MLESLIELIETEGRFYNNLSDFVSGWDLRDLLEEICSVIDSDTASRLGNTIYCHDIAEPGYIYWADMEKDDINLYEGIVWEILEDAGLIAG